MSVRYILVRMLVALLLGVAMYLTLFVLYLLAIVQHISLPFVRSMTPDQMGIRMGKALSQWLFEASQFLCFASDEKPFPWKAWPAPD
jgi:hypothetical protein